MIYELLKVGKANATTTKELMEITGLNARGITKEVSKERSEGNIICSVSSGNGGYYLPETKEEVEEFYRLMCKRAISHFKAAKSARQYLQQMDGQITFEGIVK
ncbi:MAG: hypothetical protein PUC12_04735 [Clostridiales bacterium]|nr:hypothetical protein [Clostridiales bacterium]